MLNSALWPTAAPWSVSLSGIRSTKLTLDKADFQKKARHRIIQLMTPCHNINPKLPLGLSVIPADHPETLLACTPCSGCDSRGWQNECVRFKKENMGLQCSFGNSGNRKSGVIVSGSRECAHALPCSRMEICPCTCHTSYPTHSIMQMWIKYAVWQLFYFL